MGTAATIDVRVFKRQLRAACVALGIRVEPCQNDDVPDLGACAVATLYRYQDAVGLPRYPHITAEVVHRISGAVLQPPFVELNNPTHGDRGGRARFFVVHDEEAPWTVQQCAAYFNGSNLGYGSQFTVDYRGVVSRNTRDPLAACWHVLAWNHEADGAEGTGYSTWTWKRWQQNADQLDVLAWLIAWWSWQNDVPLRRAFRGRVQLAPSGVAGHVDLTYNDHDDPKLMDLDWLIRRAQSFRLLGGPPPDVVARLRSAAQQHQKT